MARTIGETSNGAFDKMRPAGKLINSSLQKNEPPAMRHAGKRIDNVQLNSHRKKEPLATRHVEKPINGVQLNSRRKNGPPTTQRGGKRIDKIKKE